MSRSRDGLSNPCGEEAGPIRGGSRAWGGDCGGRFGSGCCGCEGGGWAEEVPGTAMELKSMRGSPGKRTEWE